MRRGYLLVLTVLFLQGPGWGQPSGASRSLYVSDAVETPQSSIDLLRDFFKTSTDGVVGVATRQKKKDASSQQSQKQTQPSAQQAQTSNQPLAVPAEQSQVQQAAQADTSQPMPDVPAQQPVATPTPTEQAVEQQNALLPTVSGTQPTVAAPNPAAGQTPEPQKTAPAPQQPLTAQELTAEAELEYAAKMLAESKNKAASQRRILPPVSQNRPTQVPRSNAKFDPNAYRPGVEWVSSKSTHFDIYTQKRTSGISSSNMPMTFESAYQTLRRFIPWMMSGRVRVFVYQDYASYLRHEPQAKAWSRAMAYPTRGEVVVYDEPNHTKELKEAFTHELTHIFTQQFFDSHKTGRLMTPVWLDEGLAVFMEDQAYNGAKGGPWAGDLRRLDIRPIKPLKPTLGGKPSLFQRTLQKKKKGKPVFFMPFEDFMQENSLESAEGQSKTQDWYLQAYTMVRFLLNPAGGSTPSNRMQFEQFTRLLSQGEAKRDAATGFLVKDARGKTVYEPYSVETALGRAYRYNTVGNFEDSFWRWMDK